MDFISIKKIKFYTKEIKKILNITLISIGFIIALILIKYKPMYEVKISGEKIGYIENKKAINETIKNNIENYNKKTIEKIELAETPEYKYYEIAYDNENVEKVEDKETAEKLVEDIKKLSSEEIKLEVNEKTTNNVQELNTNTLEVAEQNLIKKLDLKTEENTEITNINGIKIATLPVSGTISSRYGVSSSIRSSRHTGLDIAASKGTQIKVVADGTVISAEYSGSYGYLVKVDHGNGVETWYAHTSKMYVKKGEKVKAGDVIALVGSTGNSTGPHLHFEIRINGEHVNPQNYLY